MKGLPILGLGLMLLVGCKSATDTNPIGLETGPKTVKVDRQDLTGYIFLDGKMLVPPGASVTVNSPYDIPISEVLTSVGKKVSRGETLVKLSMPDMQAALTQAQTNQRTTKVAYETAKAQVNEPVRVAQQALDLARSEERAARLAIKNGESADVEAATLARQAAEEAFRLAIADRDAKLLAEKEAVIAAEEYLKEVRSGAKLSLIRAPISGWVTMLAAKQGDVAKSGSAVATVSNLRALKIQAIVLPEHSDLVKKGTEILITLEGVEGDPIKGRVQQITVLPPDAGQKSPGYAAMIDFPNENGAVRLDSTIKRLGIPTGTVKDVLTVPVGAIIKGKDGKPTVKVQSGTDWVEKPVETGISDGALIEIKSGLSEGDAVRVGG
jgi:multidrug efflux pump subunit AcrA (membrane-fusion protein)